MGSAFQFSDSPRRVSTPLLIGLVSPSGGGKTYSALRLATGIRSVRGGKLVGIDTEARRMLHYADDFQIDSYLQFAAPFGSDRYCEALKAAAARAEGGVVIVDSMSHEHEGEGGYLELHESELDRMCGDDWKRRERMTFTAWIKPAQLRRRLINTILQLPCSFIFCFRAKEKLKIITGREPIQMGWQAIAGEEFAFEMTVRCLLQPGSQGVPDWSPKAFEQGVPKRPAGVSGIVPDEAQLDERIGEALATWSKGGSADYEDAEQAASGGNRSLDQFLKRLPKARREALRTFGARLRDIASQADAAGPESEPQAAPVEPENVSQEVPVMAGVDGDDEDVLDEMFPGEPGSEG